jgi:hypothetical protein
MRCILSVSDIPAQKGEQWAYFKDENCEIIE